MSLVAGTRLGPYEIQSAIGAGGMGEVYKARDTRLDRTVAIKILSPAFSADPERCARFQREAKTIAGLNHPHICTLHDVGEHGGSTFLVMEHLAGETLAARLDKGRLPPDQALTIAAEIAHALSAAHRQGIIHRDLKPGNVMLTKSGAKLLDFGLAKLAGHGAEPAAAQVESAPTRSAPLTAEGTSVGTLQYMAPEQVEGRPADARTDLWALGAILYEVVTGRRAFEAASAAGLVAAILDHEPPPVASLQPLAPPVLDRLVRRCLAKSPDDRPDTAHDVAEELRWMREPGGQAEPTAVVPRRGAWRTASWAAVLAAACVLSGAASLWLFQRRVPAPPVVHALLDVRPAEELNGGGLSTSPSWPWIPNPGGANTSLAWTPDGLQLIFVGRRAGVQQLYARRVDADEARPLPGTEGAQVPAVSPDGQWVVFAADGVLKKAPLREGLAIDIVRDPGLWWVQGTARIPPFGQAFDDQGALLVGGGPWGIGRVPAEGDPAWVTKLREGDVRHGLPWPLPGGRTVLYTVAKADMALEEDVVAETPATGERKLLVRNAGDARYVPTGHLVFLREARLFAVPFDPERLEILGKEVPLLDGVARALTASIAYNMTGAAQYAFSSTGALAWISGGIVPFPGRSIVEVSRQGRVSALKGPSKFYAPGLGLSPDGRSVAATVVTHSDAGLWNLNLEGGGLDALAPQGKADSPKWTPDGQRVAFMWTRGSATSLAWRRADRTTPVEEVPLVDEQGKPVRGYYRLTSWHPAGRELALVVGNPPDIAVASVADGRATLRYLTRTPHGERSPEFSPDGRWLAYSSDEDGRNEIYVRPYPGPGAAARVSIDGGSCPAWGKQGRELYFIGPQEQDGGGRMMMVDVTPGATRGEPTRIGTPRPLFRFGPDLLFARGDHHSHDVSPDGERFFVVQSHPYAPLPPVTHINLILNWFEELKAKVPAGGQAK